MQAQPPRQPALRQLEVQTVQHDGRRGIALSDPLGLIGDAVFLPETVLPIVGRFDGQRSIGDVERELRDARIRVPDGFVADLVAQLDDLLLLHSPRFEQALREAGAAFLAGGARPARHAGSAGYPGETAACRGALRAMIPSATRGDQQLRGLIAPHIDLARGHAGYAAAYGRLARAPAADLYVVFGTGHQGPSAPITGLPIDWETPLGRVRTDRDFVAAIHQRVGAADPLDLYLHRHEHSLEFQVLCLAHVLGAGSFEVAGFLTGSLPSASGDPSGEGYVQRLLDAFADVARQCGKRVCYIGGADLAHIGPRFGDAEPIDAARRDRLRQEEHARLAHLQRGEPGDFHRAVEGSGNTDRVCGTSPIYLTARLAGGTGELLHYGQAVAADGSQLVSFCSVAFQ